MVYVRQIIVTAASTALSKVARFLMKAVSQLGSGIQPVGTTAYMGRKKQNISFPDLQNYDPSQAWPSIFDKCGVATSKIVSSIRVVSSFSIGYNIRQGKISLYASPSFADREASRPRYWGFCGFATYCWNR